MTDLASANPEVNSVQVPTVLPQNAQDMQITIVKWVFFTRLSDSMSIKRSLHIVLKNIPPLWCGIAFVMCRVYLTQDTGMSWATDFNKHEHNIFGDEDLSKKGMKS